jgi:hypothetical protein
MKKVAKKILWTVVIVLGLVIIVGLFLPGDYTVTRTVEISALPSDIHDYVGDLKRWPEWSPWKKADPTIEIMLGAITTGVGASQSWTDKSGGGSLTVTQSDSQTGIAYDLFFDEYPCQAKMSYEAVGPKTRVDWEMSGEAGMPVVGGYFALMMDGMVGPMFEEGLSMLKQAVEK